MRTAHDLVLSTRRWKLTKLTPYAGTDCTEEFNYIHSPQAVLRLQPYMIGALQSAAEPSRPEGSLPALHGSPGGRAHGGASGGVGTCPFSNSIQQLGACTHLSAAVALPDSCGGAVPLPCTRHPDENR